MKIKFTLKLVLSLLFLLSFTAQANETLRQDIKTAIKAVDPNVNIGIVVLPLDNKTKQANPLLFMHGNRYYTLASTTKVLTSIMALKVLGPDFHFETKLYEDKSKAGKDLYLNFNGDPTFSSKKLTALFEKGKRQFRKNQNPENLFVTLPVKAFTPSAAGWMVGDTAYCFAAPVHDIILDENCIDLNDSNQEELVKKVGVSQNVLTAKRTPTDFMGYLNYKIDRVNKVKNLADHLSFQKIKMPRQSHHLLASIPSPQLHELLHPILKDSENMPTDAIYLAMGKKQNIYQWGPVGDWIRKKFDEYYHVDMSGAVMTDGSGLSRYNSLTPLQLARALEAAYYDREVAPYFMRALPKMGVDGSLKMRLQKSELRGKFIGKTGTMTGVSTIGGYLTVKNKKYVTIVFMNNYTENRQRYRKLQDRILEIIYQDLNKT